jgi:imidazolonepropionase-like amidohydrolase
MTGRRTDGRAVLLLGLLTCALADQAATQGVERVTVIRNATIVPVVGDTIRGGTVVIRGSRIESVGRDLPAPAGARVVDGSGLFLYPGMIDSGTELGLTEIQSVPGGNDTRELGDFNPQNLSLTAVNPSSELIPVARVNGITSAIIGASGGVVSGYAALIDLAGWTTAEMGVQPRAAMVITYPRVAGGRFGGGRRGGAQAEAGDQVNRQVTQLMDYFRKAREYRETRARVTAAGGQLPKPDAAMEAMIPVLDGTVPVVFDVTTAAQIRGALTVADSFTLRPILRGANDAWQLADTLAARKVPVIVGPTTVAPGDEDPYDMIYATPGVLAKAGVLIAFRTNSAADARNLPYNVALSLAYGLEPEEALRSVTINPARIWGVADRLGSIEPGKVANLMLTTGDPLDVRTEVRQVFIRGDMIPMTDRHTRLYEQFRVRPR